LLSPDQRGRIAGLFEHIDAVFDILCFVTAEFHRFATRGAWGMQKRIRSASVSPSTSGTARRCEITSRTTAGSRRD